MPHTARSIPRCTVYAGYWLRRALLLSDGKLSLNPAVCWVDAWAFERLLTAR